MPYSASTLVEVNVSLSGLGPQPAAYGIPVQIFESAVSSGSRLHGPFLSAADVTDFGYTAGSPPHLWAQALMMQQPHVSQFYIGRRDSGDADDGEAFDAIVASNPGTGYIFNSALRDAAETLALAAAVEASTYPKIAIAQSNDGSLLTGLGPSWSHVISGTVADGTMTLTFTGFGLEAPVVITATRTAGSPATNALFLAALATALESAADVGEDLEDVVDPDSIEVTSTTLTYRIAEGLASGTVTAGGTAVASTIDLTATQTDAGLASMMFGSQYTRTALMYYSTDATYADGAWTSRCGSFDLDTRKGIWAHKRLIGITGDSLSNLQIAALRSNNANYFGPAIATSGVPTQSFTAQGWMPFGTAAAGRRIDVTISLDWLQARLQEAGLAVLLGASHGVLATPAGINLFTAAFKRVLRKGVEAGHLMDFVVPEDEEYAGTLTPAVWAPDIRTQTATQRASRSQTWSILCYLAPYVEAVVVNVQVNQ
jgi:hypothetical protein